jgi:hypothetical protein
MKVEGFRRPPEHSGEIQPFLSLSYTMNIVCALPRRRFISVSCVLLLHAQFLIAPG